MEVLLVSPVRPLFIVLAKAVPYFVLSFVNLTTILLLSVFVLDVPVSGEFVLVGDGVFALYFRVAGFGFADFLCDKYTGGGHAGIRNDIDDAHHGFVRNDFSGRKYAGDSPGHIGYYSRPLVYSGCAQTDD